MGLSQTYNCLEWVAFLLFYLPSGITETLRPSIFLPTQPIAGYGWTCVCWDKIVTIYLTENVKSFLMYTLVFNIWASFPDLGRNTLVFCYCWWVKINKVTLTAIINIRLRWNKWFGSFRALTMNVMNMMSS